MIVTKTQRDHSQSNGHRKKIRKTGFDDAAIAGSKDQHLHLSQSQQQSVPDALTEQEGASLTKALNFSSFAPSSNPLPRYTKPTRPFKGNTQTLPPLPQIPSDELASMCFTHQGFHHGSIISNLHRTYERLEFLGDAYIEVIATRLVYTKFPDLTAGRLSQRRELCVKNETLAQYATLYGFPQRAKLPPNFNREDRKIWTKTLGDIFEAYVAAVILSDPENGFQSAEAWLTTLWEYELSKEQRGSKVEAQNVKIDSKNELIKVTGGRNVKIDYKEVKAPESIRDQGKMIYHFGAFLTGWHWANEYLASGSGLSKQEAGQMAAANAMQNPLVQQDVIRVKKEYDALVAAAREKGEEAPPFKSLPGKSDRVKR